MAYILSDRGELDQNVGVKGVLRDLEREARKLAQEAGAEGN